MPTPSCFRPGVRVEPKFDGDYTFNTGHVKSFTILDYTIFLLSLLIPTLIGFHQAWRGNTELDDYMLARRSMSYIPVGLSLLASFLSAITTIGAPAEIYEHDTLYVWVGLSFCIVSAASAHIYMPVFYKLKINSVYEVRNVTPQGEKTKKKKSNKKTKKESLILNILLLLLL